MADKLERVGLVFKADGTVDFNKSLKEVNSSIQENRSAFNLAKSTWDESTKSAEKLRTEQKYLASQTKDYSDKVILLQRQLEELESAEVRDEKAIHNKKSQLNQTKTTLNNYKKALKDVESELKSGSASMKDYGKKLDDIGEKAKNAGEKMSGISAGAAGIVAAVTATVPATEEYRKIMASLESSSELAGYTAEQTKEVYKNLFGVLGDDQTAATTTANLQALGLTQEQLVQLTNGTIGAWAKYGDSIPIDGLAEAINETVKVGKVTGTFADVLNWAGTSEDGFNEKLELCSSESERANMIMQELANQGLTQAGKKWQENNKTLVESNQSQADFQEQVAELAETVAPIMTDVTEIVTDLLKRFNELPEGTQKTIGAVILMVAALGPLLSGIGMVTSGIGGMMNATSGIGGLITSGAPKIMSVLGGIGNGAKALFGIVAANPVIAIIMAIIATVVILYNKCEWFRNGVNKIFEGIKSIIKNSVEKIKDFLSFEWKLPKIKLPHFNISGKFSLNPPSIPKFSVDWYAKGGILNRPIIFGMDDDKLLGGGEAGKEAVLPIDLLRNYIREENKLSSDVLIEALLDAFGHMVITPEISLYIGNEKITDMMTDSVRAKISNQQNMKWRSKGHALQS